MPEKGGTWLVTAGVLSLGMIFLGAMLDSRCWPGLLLLGTPLIALGCDSVKEQADSAEIAGLWAYVTLGQGLVCMCTCTPVIIGISVLLIAWGVMAEVSEKRAAEKLREEARHQEMHKPRRRRIRRRRH